ncbi:phytanoyl-CoA dioxygenase family protein [Winogradskyella sp.]|uniref:phytanoyl-CoA dioxygenase family protein n=1 Tax=Winogradskyella sp. TaxID=1883156 RepID=UPI0025E40779|nr:phytanoyl-CoA dioxygenase family protein [Winogradskyella sp.]
MHKICSLYIDNQPFQFKVEGDFFWGKPELLYVNKDNVLSKMDWETEGFNVVKAFEGDEFFRLQNSIRTIIIDALIENGVDTDVSTFKLKDYHKFVTTKELHNNVINITRNLEVSDFDFDIDLLAKRFGDILGYELTSWVEELQKSHIQIRISRPNSLDINPPHRDGYLSYWEDIVNVWLPIEGCNEKSSLPVLPESHLLPENEILRTESKGAKINGNVYYVPCILETKAGPIQMIRPNPKEGEALLFTPFLIHGAAVNQNEDVTRVSLELRFPKVKS